MPPIRLRGVAKNPFLPCLETTMTRYIRLTLGELAQINDSLRIMELSLMWYGIAVNRLTST